VYLANMLVHSASPSTVPAGEPQPLPARRFHGNRYVYTVLSQRAGGLSVGINLNPDQRCNFDCIYCEIERKGRGGSRVVHVPVMVQELEHMLGLLRAGAFAKLGYEGVPAELLALKEVAISGDGEPTLCPNFREALEAILRVRAHQPLPAFKVVLITNAIGLGFPKVREGIAQLDDEDEVWVKLDAGTQAYMDVVNQPGISIEVILKSIRDLARLRPVVVQSLFPLIDGKGPSESEVEAYAQSLLELKEEGARISLVQIYSAHRPAVEARCGHLPLRALSKIAHRVRELTGLNAEVF
jgi:wyosine [tRNA(Phe)-imidazoG37] synthetase (radical SAM superfamily)